MTDNRNRWRILDELLGAGEPVSTEAIFRTWENHGFPVRYGTEGKTLQERYEITLRQDLYKFKKVYKEAGYNNPLLIISTSIHDRRRRFYQYADPGFSIMPLLGERYSKADWKVIDHALEQLFEIIPEELADKINFFVNGRIDSFRNGDSFVDWSDNPQLLGYDMLPRLYRYVKQKQPVLLSFAMFNQSADQFVLHPYLLKEYNGRWYCLGYREDQQMLWPISVDRIKKGSICAIDVPFREFTHTSCASAIEYFSNIIGVTKEYNDVTARDFLVSDKEYEVILKISSKREWMYITTNPIHHSQRTIEDFSETTGEGRVSISVICNIEMYNTILARGGNVQIESPDFARGTIRSMIKEMSALYL